MRIVPNRRPLFVAALVLIALVVTAQSAAAFTILSSTGLRGSYSLTDAASPVGHQADVCSYDLATYRLTKIEVRHPAVKARNRTSGRDHQSVGWQFIVQHQTPSGTTWATVFASTFAKATAADNLAAAFVNRTWAAPADPTGKYRVLLVIRWYAPGSTSVIQGQVKLLGTNYTSTWNGNSQVSQGFCLQDY